ncbi:MAG: aminotransferase class I/II-fold pyridoxal phosphate-dependent enzyme [Candidatus Aminicenantes bacterium]|nr:aminotransferase class I/II-fold pyridoxal phosphate-dependent enzyme [Candidatus Aminicenantes bacterium]
MSIENFISKKVASIPKSAIHEMTALSKKIEDVAFLSWAKPTSGTPDHINRAASEAILRGLTGGYSETAGFEELRVEITRKLQRDNHISADPSEILVTVGAIEGLSAAVMTAVDPGDEVIIPVPGYSTHIRQVELASGKPVLIPTIEDQGFKLDLDQLQDAVTTKTKAIVFSSPNNPTGAVYSEEELRSIADIAERNNLIIITDEAYEYFTFDGIKHFSIGSIEGIKDRVISTFTFTKTYAMTGWRVGYLHASRDWIAQIKKAHIPLCICAPVVSQYAALEALRGPQDCIDRFHSHYLKTRNLMCSRLDQLEHVFTYQKPRGSYLMFPRMIRPQDQDSRTFAIDLLQKARVSTTPGIAFKGEGHIRMSFCVPEEEIHKAFDRMEEYFSS